MISPAAMTQARILVADDSRAVRESVTTALRPLEHVHLIFVENGAQALKEACSGHYSLLLSDIEMPVMNGLQLLRVIRTQFFSGTELPIIMLTQLNHADQKVRAFADGANDYVTKPVEPQELLARVKAQLQLRALHRENMANQALSLHAQKLAAVAQLSATLAHELNTPAQYIGDNLAFLNESFAAFQAWLKLNRTTLPDDLAYLRDEIPNALRDMRLGVERVTKLVHTIAEFAEPGSQRTSTVDLERSIDTVVDLLRSRWLGVVEMTTHHSTQVGTVHCNPIDLKHALWQLLVQAIDDASATSSNQGTVDIATQLDHQHAVVSVRATRRGPRPVNTAPPPPDSDALRLTSAVLHRHRGELTREVAADGSTTSVIRLVL
ncbi:MAG: hypothetical protein RL701_6065 [Pseudomonadota bacterium]